MIGLKHRCIDGYDARSLPLKDQSHPYDFFQALSIPSALSHFLFYEDHTHSEMEGLTATLLAPGIHSTIHTYTHENKRCYFQDHFSYQDSQSKALDELTHRYNPNFTMEYHFVRNGELPLDLSITEHPIYGPHMMVEFSLQKEHSISPQSVENFLHELPSAIEMHPITHVFHAESDLWQSALRVIAESHIALHIHKPTGRVFFDVFSCKPFDTEKVLHVLEKFFQYTDYTSHILQRGIYFPRKKI